MGTWNYLWYIIFSLFLCTKAVTSAPPQIHTNGFPSTQPAGTTGLAVHNSSATTAEPSVMTAHSLLDTSLLSPSMMQMVGGEETMETEPAAPNWEESSLGTPTRSDAMSPAVPTAESGTAATSTGTASASVSSLPPRPSSAVTSHSPSSPTGSTAATPSPERSSTSGTTEVGSAGTSHPPTAFVFSTLSSVSGTTGIGSDTVAAENTMRSPAPSTHSTNPVTSTSSPSPVSRITKSSLSSTLGDSTETSAAGHTSTALTQGQATVEAGTTSPSMGSPSPSMTTVPVATSVVTLPGEGETPTTNQGSRTTDPYAETSHFLPATTLATPSTTNISISTPVNPPFTGTCSPITLSIQLQNVTSTVIQFSWKPQGGTGDSPYAVSLLGKSGEMRKLILNETSAAFENLLSGHQYRISVDVSTCSKNVSASLTVQTAAEVYSGTTRITNIDFKSEYQNKSSREFQEFETKFMTEITKHLPQEIQELKNGTKMHILINSIKNGSVVVLFDIVLDVGQNITKQEISDASTEALNMSTEFEVDLQKTVIEARNSCQPELNDCSQHAACTAEGATYSCQCNEGFTDKSPQVPGRICRQDLPSEQTTTVPTENNIPGFTKQTATVPPENETRFTEQTTVVPPENETGFTEDATTVAPENETTGFTEQTTIIPPENKTGFAELTTTVPQENYTTGITEQMTTLPPENETTGFTEYTSTVPPENYTTEFTEQTTTVPPENETTGFTEQTTIIPPENETGFAELTTTVPPENETTGITEQTTTVSHENYTTGVTGSTSNSFFTTTFTSVHCLPVSIEVQNVTGEGIQLSWTSDSTGSLYSIFLMDGNQEMHKTTNETKYVFQNLLPGHVYNISVAVSPCADNNRSSVTVRTDPDSCFSKTKFCLAENTGCSDLRDTVCSNNQAFFCSVWLKSQIFNNTLYNSESQDYKEMSESFKREVVREMRLELNDEGFDIIVLGFKRGSVIADFISLLPKEDPVDVNLVQDRLNQILKGKFGPETEVTVQSLSVQSSTDNSSAWRLAVIVLGVLLGVALVLILLAILFYIYTRKRLSEYLVEPTGLMGTFAHKHL